MELMQKVRGSIEIMVFAEDVEEKRLIQIKDTALTVGLEGALS